MNLRSSVRYDWRWNRVQLDFISLRSSVDAGWWKEFFSVFKLKTPASEKTIDLKLVVTPLRPDVMANFLYLSPLGYQKNLLTRKRRAEQIIVSWVCSWVYSSSCLMWSCSKPKETGRSPAPLQTLMPEAGFCTGDWDIPVMGIYALCYFPKQKTCGLFCRDTAAHSPFVVLSLQS